MKLFKTTVKSLLSGLLCITMAAPMVVSCYDDTAIWEEIDGINGRLNDLEAKLNGQIQALSDLVAGGDILISSLDKKEDGSYLVTLSNGTKFSVLPAGTSVTGIVTYKVIDGVGYWAKYEADGTLKLILDDSGNKIPVETEVPTVKEKDGKFYLVIGDKEYETGFDSDTVVSIITDYEINKDETGNVYSVTFTFGSEELTFTVPMKGYLGFSFRLGSAGQTRVIKDYYVDFASTSQIIAGMDGVVDYVLQIPDGWRVTEEKDELMGETYLNITAPSKAAVQAGDAVAEGDLKVVAVVEGGKAMAARLFLTTSPFKTFTTTSSNAVMEIRNGVDKFIYGLVEYPMDEAAVFAEAKALLAANDKGVAMGNVNIPLSEISSTQISSGIRYVLWAMPAFYDYKEDGAGYYLKEGVTATYEFTYNNIKLENVSVAYNDALIKLDMGGATSFFGGTVIKSDTWVEEALVEMNNGLTDPYKQPLAYEGSAFSFPVASVLTPEPGETYVTWVAPFVEGKEAYLKDDIVYVEYTLSEITSGGSVNIAAGDAVISRISVEVPLTAEGATSVLYIFESDRTAGRYKTQEAQAEYLLASGTRVNEQACTAFKDKLKPSTDWVLFAMAIDKDGKYGTVIKETYTTEDIVYNDLEVKLSVNGDPSSKWAEVKVEVSGGTSEELLWWYGRETDTFWTSEEYCNKRKADAEEYMSLYPNDSAIQRAMSSSTLSDGILRMEELVPSSNYVVVMLAKDQSGEYSHAGQVKFSTLSADLGTLVLSDNQKWVDAKKFIEDNIVWNEDEFYLPGQSMGYGAYSFDIKIPTDLTAYITCFATEATKMTEIILEVEELAGGMTIENPVIYDENGNQPTLPDWYDDNGKFIQGTLLNVAKMYPHGAASKGYVTYFPSSGHADCFAWESGKCSHYEHQKNLIAQYCSLDYWREFIIDFGNYTHEGDPNSPHSRSLKDPEKIEAIASQYHQLYYKYYHGTEPIIFVNNGDALHVVDREATGLDTNGNVVEQVTVVLRDKDGNYYEPIYIPVPNYFE